MPANLTPEYRAAEEAFGKRSSAEGQLDASYRVDQDENSIEVSTYPVPSQDRL